MNGISTKIYGKMDGYFPQSYELNPDVVIDSLSGIIPVNDNSPRNKTSMNNDIAPRPRCSAQVVLTGGHTTL